jgi:hypothetical protein
VRLPKEYRLKGTEVEIFRRGDEIVLRERPTDWCGPSRFSPSSQMTFYRKAATILYRRSGKAFEWPRASCSTQIFATISGGAARRRFLERFRQLTPGETVLSVITYGELVYGAQKSQFREQALKQLAELAGLLPVLKLPM